MSKLVIDKKLITAIAAQSNKDFYNHVESKVESVLSASIERLGLQIPYISLNNVVLQPFNEVLSGAVTDNSTFYYLLGINNAQLELNTVKTNMFWHNLKKRLKIAWDSRKRRKKKKKKKDEKSLAEKVDFDGSKYNLFNLTKDLFETIRLFLSQTSIISMDDNFLYIVGKDDFGSNTQIKIEICFYNEDCFKFFEGKKKLKQYNFSCRLKCLSEKKLEAGDNFVKMLKIFNVLYHQANHEMPNAMFMESVLYNVPDKLYDEQNIYDVFIKIVNYLNLKSINNFNSVNDLKLKLYQDQMLGYNQQVGLLKMLRMIADNK